MLILGGEQIANTEWIRVDKMNAWWPNFDYQTMKRKPLVDLLCGHWTAGEAGIKTFDDDGPRVVAAMKARMSTKTVGRRLKVSVGFVIGACDENAAYAPIWQTMDIGVAAGVHVGGLVNDRSVGVEIVNCGAPGSLNIRKRPTVVRNYLNTKIKTCPYYPGQIRTWQRLSNLLTLGSLPEDQLQADEKPVADALKRFGIVIPRQIPVTGGRVITRRMSRSELTQWSGIMEHFLMYNTKKRDAGMYCLDACEALGYKKVEM